MTKNGASPRYHRPLLLLIGILLITLLVFTLWQIMDVYQSTREAMQKRQTIYAAALAEHAERALGEAMLILDDMADDISQLGGPEKLSEKELYTRFSNKVKKAPQLGSLFLVNEQGGLSAASLQYPAKPLDLSDRDYFRYHRDTPSGGVQVSAPYKSKLDGIWRFNVSRRMNRTDSSFAGVLAVSLSVDYFEKIYQEFQPLPTERISLIRTDGSFQVLLPFNDVAFTTSMKGSELFTRYLPQSSSGSFESASYSYDKSHRLVSYRSLKNAPLIASISIEPSAALAPWRVRAFERMAMLLVTASVIVWLGLRLARQIAGAHEQLEQKVAQRTSDLSHATHQWQTTFDAISDSVSLIDLKQRILRCNLASKRLFNRDFDQIIGQHCWVLVHGTDHPIGDCPMQAAQQSLKTETRTILQNDRWLQVTVDPILGAEGQLTGAVHIVRDDTDRTHAEESLKEQLAMLEAVQNELYVFKPDSLLFEYANHSALSNIGYTLEQVQRMTPLDLKPFTREQLEDLLQPLQQGKPVVRLETTHVRADGSSYPVEVNLQMVATRNGYRYLAVIHDISQRKQDESAVREMETQMLHQDKLASIGQLSAGIAHEINNPMGFINSNLGTLEKYVEKFDSYITLLEELVQQTGDPQSWQTATAVKRSLKLDYVLRDVRSLLQESEDGAERVMKIVQDLRIFARSDSAQTGKADLNQCLDSTLTIVRNQIKYVAELIKDYGELPRVSCNIQQINQIFMNLLVNAVHAIEEKALEKPGTVTIKTWADANYAFVAISDTGCGIPEELRSRIFDPFFTTKEVGKGTGLGLSISHEIIKKHGGEITVESEEGRGTIFTVKLPLVPPEQTGKNV